MENCIFCRIAAKEIPAEVVWEDENVMAFRDIDPVAPTHVVVIPKRHIQSTMDLTEADAGLLLDVFRAASEVARLEGREETGIRILTNVGPDAGQDVLHMHFHVLGGIRMGWPPC